MPTCNFVRFSLRTGMLENRPNYDGVLISIRLERVFCQRVRCSRACGSHPLQAAGIAGADYACFMRLWGAPKQRNFS